MKKDPIMSKLSVLSLDTNPELESITCTRNTEISPSTELSVNFTWIWLVITELPEILFLSSELLSYPERMISEDLTLTSTEATASNSLSSGLFLELAIKDTELFSNPPNQELSDNDLLSLFKNDLHMFIHLSIYLN
jgi:hypothetical protein